MQNPVGRDFFRTSKNKLPSGMRVMDHNEPLQTWFIQSNTLGQAFHSEDLILTTQPPELVRRDKGYTNKKDVTIERSISNQQDSFCKLLVGRGCPCRSKAAMAPLFLPPGEVEKPLWLTSTASKLTFH